MNVVMNNKYKITGRLVGGYKNSEGELISIEKIKYARFDWTMRLKLFYMRLFYDYVDVEEIDVK